MKNQIYGVAIGTIVGMVIASAFNFSLAALWAKTFREHPNEEKNTLPQVDPVQLWMNSVTSFFK